MAAENPDNVEITEAGVTHENRYGSDSCERHRLIGECLLQEGGAGQDGEEPAGQVRRKKTRNWRNLFCDFPFFKKEA